MVIFLHINRYKNLMPVLLWFEDFKPKILFNDTQWRTFLCLFYFSSAPVKKSNDLCSEEAETVSDLDRLWTNTSPMASKCDARLYGVYRFGPHSNAWWLKEGCETNDNADVAFRCGSGLQVPESPCKKKILFLILFDSMHLALRVVVYFFYIKTCFTNLYKTV